MKAGTSAEPGLMESLRRLSGTAVSMLHSRMALASLELGEARDRLVMTLLAGALGVLLLCAGLVALSVWLAFVLWPLMGPTVIALMAVVYLVSGLGLLWWVQQRGRDEPALLEDTIAELQNDAAALRGRATAPVAPSSHRGSGVS